MDCSMSAFPAHHHLLKFAQSHVHRVSDAIQLSHPRFCLLLPSIFPSLRIFYNELTLPIRWPKYWSFSFSISPSSEYLGLISFRLDWFDLLAAQGTLKSLLQHHNLKHQFFGTQPSLDFPGGSDGKESACNVGDMGSIPGLGRSPGKGSGNPLQYSCLENSMDRGAWLATVHGVTKSWTRLSDFYSLGLLYGPALTSIHDYWKNHSFYYMDLCRQSDISAF